MTACLKGWSQRIAVVFLGKSELGLTPETDEQCVGALWFMDRPFLMLAGFSLE